MAVMFGLLFWKGRCIQETAIKQYRTRSLSVIDAGFDHLKKKNLSRQLQVGHIWIGNFSLEIKDVLSWLRAWNSNDDITSDRKEKYWKSQSNVSAKTFKVCLQMQGY